MPVKQEKIRAQEKPALIPSVRKLQFGAIAKKKPDSRTSYPLLPDPQGQYATIAARIIDRAAQVEALTGALEVDKAELKTLAASFYFTNGQGKLEVPSSVAVSCACGQVLITYQNRYGKLESEEPLLPILGPQTGRFFRQAFTLEIDGDKLPAEQTQELLDELQELFSSYQASDALKVRDVIKPVPEFHTLRHTALTPEQNLALDQVCPIIAMVKVKAQGVIWLNRIRHPELQKSSGTDSIEPAISTIDAPVGGQIPSPGRWRPRRLAPIQPARLTAGHWSGPCPKPASGVTNPSTTAGALWSMRLLARCSTAMASG